MNAVLGFADYDSDDYYFGGDRTSSVVTGANCKPYLTAGVEELRVNLTDCYGNALGQVSFEDYIIGVANAEVSNKNEDYVLSEMVAAISFALGRRSNYSKGSVITMRSGTCDQAYCNPNKGCTVKNTPVGTCQVCNSFYIGGSRGRVNGLYETYRAYYEKAANFLVVKDGKVKTTGYVSSVQNEWYAKASAGMSFTQIIAETYPDSQVIRCSDNDTTENSSSTTSNGAGSISQPAESTVKYGNTATSEYPKVAPDKGTYYGFSYANSSDGTHISINSDWKKNNLVTVSPNCSGSPEFSNMKFTINKKAVDKYKKAFNGICKILTTGVKLSDGSTCKMTASHLLDGEVFLEKKASNGDIDLHAYGLAQDWNYSARYTINGTSYRPYSSRSLEDYIKFTDAIGGEEKCQNINYILYKYAYKDAGFEWGGNFGRNGNSGSFDGKLFQIKYQ
mgnify:CR=1 FL=1